MQLKKTSKKIGSLINELRTFSNGYFSFNNIDGYFSFNNIDFINLTEKISNKLGSFIRFRIFHKCN